MPPVLKPKGSAVFIFQPNYEKSGRCDFGCGSSWPGLAKNGILSKMCIGGRRMLYRWREQTEDRTDAAERQDVRLVGPADCYRNQDAVLWTPSQAMMAKHRTDFALRIGPNGRTYRNGTIAQAADERGGMTPFNVLPIPTGGRRAVPNIILLPRLTMSPHGGEVHSSRWRRSSRSILWQRTMLAAGSITVHKVIGIDKEKKYLAIAKRRITTG